MESCFLCILAFIGYQVVKLNTRLICSLHIFIGEMAQKASLAVDQEIMREDHSKSNLRC